MSIPARRQVPPSAWSLGDSTPPGVPEEFPARYSSIQSSLTSVGKVEAMLQSYINQASVRMNASLPAEYTVPAKAAFNALASARDYLRLVAPKVAMAATLGRNVLNSVPLGPDAVDTAVSQFDAAYSQAQSLLKVAHDKAQSAIALAVSSEKAGAEPVTAGKVLKAAGESASEAGSLVVRGARQTGQAVIAAGQGASALAPYAKYAAPVGLALLGLYVFMLLPRPRHA